MQSNRARVVLLLIAVAAIVVLFVVLSGEDDDTSSTTTTPTSESADANGNGGKGKDEQPKGGGEDGGEPSVPTIVVEGGELQGEVTEISVNSGDEVRFAVLSDTATEIHVHGYEIYEDVPADKKTEIKFPADLEGAYEIETHIEPLIVIAELKVNPG